MRDDEGKPLRARIAAVDPQGGSYSTSTDDQGRFALPAEAWMGSVFTLHASTGDARLDVRSEVSYGTVGLELVVHPAASVTVRIERDGSARCAFFHRGARIEDFTLRNGKRARVVVPVGEVNVELYEGQRVYARRTIDLDVGEHLDLAFDLAD